MKTGAFVATALAAAVTLAACGGTNEPMTAQAAASEKCFGVAQAGKNDCAGAGHACAGQSTASRAPEDFIALPAGTCEKLVGGVVG
jgi:uncharacterized membrane protein